MPQLTDAGRAWARENIRRHPVLARTALYGDPNSAGFYDGAFCRSCIRQVNATARA